MDINESLEKFSENLFFIKSEEEDFKKFTITSKNKKELFSFTFEHNEIEDFLLFDNFHVRCHPTPIELFEINSTLFGVGGSLNVKKTEIRNYPFKFELEQEWIENHLTKLVNTPEFIIMEYKRPKICHYIQQAYLRGFMSNIEQLKGFNPDKIRKKARIFCFDKIHEEILVKGNSQIEKDFGVRIRAIGYDDYFYSMAFEFFINKYSEQYFAQVRDKIIFQESTEGLTQYERIFIMEYMILQWNRTPKARKIFEDQNRKFTKAMIKGLKNIPPEDYYIQFPKGYTRSQQEQITMDFIRPSSKSYIIPYLLKYKMGVVKAPQNKFFLTSDNPVVLTNPYYKSIYREFGKEKYEELHSSKFLSNSDKEGAILIQSNDMGLAPAAKGIHFYFPISSKLCIFLIDGNPYPRIKPFRLNHVNNLIIEEADIYIFSTVLDFNKVSRYIQNNPSCKQIKFSKVWTK